MDISPTNINAQRAPREDTPTKTSGVSSDFETFLKMLTVQMQNQDPLNPIESSDYAVQLATFSGVEQQVRTNDLLAALGSQFSSTGLSQLAGWVGMEAKVAAPAPFSGQPITLHPTFAADAQSAYLSVKDSSGVEVQRLQIDPVAGPIDWAGVSDIGSPFADGSFSFFVESFDGEGLATTLQAEVYLQVTEAKIGGDKALIVLQGGATVEADDVSALRAIGGAASE